MALPTPVQIASGAGTSASTVVATFAGGVSGGNLTGVTVFAGPLVSTPSTVLSVTNDKGDSYVLLDQQAAGTGTTSAAGVFAYCLNTTAGATIITATLSQNATISKSEAGEWSLIGAVLDKHIAANGTTTSAASGSTATTTVASALQIGWVAARCLGTMSLSSPSPANDLSQSSGTSQVAAFSDALLSSLGTQSASYTIGGTSSFAWACGTAIFSSPTVKSLSLLGCGV